MWLAATNGFSLGFKKGKPAVALPQARRSAMVKKQQPSPPSETFVDAAQLPAAEILAGELVSVVARNVESGRLSEHAISQAWATALARLGLAAAADGASGGSTTLVPGSSSRQVASAQEIFDALVEILGGDKPLLIIPAILGNNNHGGIDCRPSELTSDPCFPLHQHAKALMRHFLA